MLLKFDEIDDWVPSLTAALSEHLPNGIESVLVARTPEYIEDARDLIFELANRDAIIDATLAWVRSSALAGYHGTKLTDEEAASVELNGLLPLRAEARRDRLIRALSRHPKWRKVADQLDDAIQAHGQGGKSGRRENQVHLTLSRSGLVNGFNHYLTHGSEFDQRVAESLLGSEGKDLLRHDGLSRVVEVAVPGAIAIDRAHVYFSVEDVRQQGEVPNIVDEFLKSWSFKLAHPQFQTRTLKLDCGLIFYDSVPAEMISKVEILDL